MQVAHVFIDLRFNVSIASELFHFDHSFVENIRPHIIVIINNQLVEYENFTPRECHFPCVASQI